MVENSKKEKSSHQLWAEFRFGVIGALLSNPPGVGELRLRLKILSETQWRHPIHGGKYRISIPTIERWYYRSSKQNKDPVGALRRKLRSDSGTTRHLTLEMKNWLQTNYVDHPSWSGQLHCDNLRAWLKENPSYGMAPSYPTIIRYLRARGFTKRHRVRSPNAPGRLVAARRLEEREVRSYEVEYVGGLWHLDIHHGSRTVQTEKGEILTPLALCIIDDHSRLVCHIQWYLSEDTRSLVHGFIQALQKRGLPRALLTDNGSAMISREFTEGCMRLGIQTENTLPYSPYQNGKQESFWGTLEGRLMAMCEGKRDLSLEDLNQVTNAWVEVEYNRAIHSETKSSPIDRWCNGKSVLRPSPDGDILKLSFRRDEVRIQRRSDGTVSILGKRFEIPNAYRPIHKVTVRYAQWDLSRVHLIDERTQSALSAIYPVDRKRNAQGLRRRISSSSVGTLPDDQLSKKTENEWPPLLQNILAEYAATGLPPAYISDLNASIDSESISINEDNLEAINLNKEENL